MALDAFILQHVKCIHNFIRLLFYIFVLNIQIKVEKNAKILLNMTKPPVGGGKCLFSWESHLLIHSTDSFKRLIHSETSQLTVIVNGPLNQLTHSIHSNTWIHSVTKHRKHCVLLRDTQQFCCVFDRNYFRMRNWAKTVSILSKI